MVDKEYLFLQFMSNIQPAGDIVVAGTYEGEDVRSMYRGSNNRNIVVVDSFEGLDDPKPEDIEEEVMKKGECNIGGLDRYLEIFKQEKTDPPQEIYKMWIDKKSLEIIPKRELSILFLDLDHYQPTKDCLEYFFDWVIDDGIIIVHDYGFERCPGIKKCCDEFKEGWTKINDTGFAILKK